MGPENVAREEKTPGTPEMGVQTPAGSGVLPREEEAETLELRYDTWGSYGQYARTLAILKDGTVLDPSLAGRAVPGGEAKKVIRVGGEEVVAVVVNNSSRKNAHYIVRIPASVVLAVIADSATSSGWKGFRVLRGGGEVVAEELEEKREDEKYVYVRRIVVYYYVNAGIKVPLKEVVVATEKTLKGRPVVKIRTNGSRILVSGDTFHVRDTLKQLRFAWDALGRQWYKRVEGDAETEKRRVAEVLSSVADVEVE